MNKENNRKATSNLSRLVEYFVFQDPGLSVLCPDCITVAAASKNKEARAPLFFSRHQRSKVIFRVTRKYLALRGGSLFHPLPVVAGSRSQRTTFSLMRPVVAFRGCPGASLSRNRSGWNHLPMVAFRYGFPLETDIPATVSNFHNLKIICYGKEK